jgi:hypothetical protein
MNEYTCKICGNIVMSEKYCLKKDDELLRFCCERCMEKYQEKTRLESKPVSSG